LRIKKDMSEHKLNVKVVKNRTCSHDWWHLIKFILINTQF
jgi:hypothetical protein